MLKSEQRLAEILADRVHGSRTITRGILDVLYSDLAPTSISHDAFVNFARCITSRIPSFALVFDLLHHLGNTLLLTGDTTSASALQAEARAWEARWSSTQREVNRHGVQILSQAATVTTFSSSGAVLDILAAAASRRQMLTVIGSEAQPGGEGKDFMEAVRTQGHEVHLLDDRELPGRAESSDLVLLGADAVFLEHFWNKVGSDALCRAARAAEVPVYVAAETLKWVPSDWGLWIDPHVAPTTGSRSTEHNSDSCALFESVPQSLITALLSERGAINPGAISPIIAAKRTFAPLRTLT